jgi:hypothetical protein
MGGSEFDYSDEYDEDGGGKPGKVSCTRGRLHFFVSVHFSRACDCLNVVLVFLSPSNLRLTMASFACECRLWRTSRTTRR